MTTSTWAAPRAAAAPPRASAQVFEPAAAVVALVVMSGALARAGTVSAFAQAAVGVAAGARLALRPARAWLTGTDPWLLVLLLAGLVSLTQSLLPVLGSFRLGEAICYTVFGLYLADRFTRVELLMLVVTATAIAAAVVVCVALLLPQWAQMPEQDPAWRGVFVQKNILARTAVLGCVGAVYLLSTQLRRRERALTIAALPLLVVSLVEARSAFAAPVLAVAAVPLMVRAARRLSPPLPGAVAAVACAAAVTTAVAVTTHGGLLNVLGKDPSLNGRLPLWSSVVDAVRQHPWLGYGYGTFWQGWHPPSTMVLLRNVWGPPHAHNGALEMALGVGIAGAAVWVLLLVRGLVTAAVLSRGATAAADELWPLAFAVLLLAYNVVEVTTTSNALFWALFIAVTTQARRDVRRGRRRRPWPGAPSSAR